MEGNGGSTITQQVSKLLCLGVPYDPATWKSEADYETDCRKGGIVRSEDAIAEALTEMIAFMEAAGFSHRLSIPSPITGGDGNTETVAIFRKNTVLV